MRLLRPLPDNRRAEVLEQLSQASSPSLDYFVLVVLSTSIATFGLITNSSAVVIGAMLVAPLMSPILGLSLASVAGKHGLFERAAIALFRGIVLAVLLSSTISWIATLLPLDVFQVLPDEVLSRTHPTLFDLGIALAGGAAAAYALAQPNISAALPGVAIATALVPPLCTVGVGISLQRLDIVLGAALLFVTNLVTISFSGILVFGALGFRPHYQVERIFGLPRHFVISTGLVFAVTSLLVMLTANIVTQSRQQRALQDIKNEAASVAANELRIFPNTQLVGVESTLDGVTVNLLITIRSTNLPSYAQVVNLQQNIANRLQRPVALQLINVPMIRLDPKIPPTATATPTLGPSPTATRTPTATATRVPPSSTATVTATPTQTATVTQTYTPTPVLAYIASPDRNGAYLRDAPAGKIVAGLPEGAPIQILYGRVTIDGAVWIEVRDILGRTGWVLARHVIIKP